MNICSIFERHRMFLIQFTQFVFQDFNDILYLMEDHDILLCMYAMLPIREPSPISLQYRSVNVSKHLQGKVLTAQQTCA